MSKEEGHLHGGHDPRVPGERGLCEDYWLAIPTALSDFILTEGGRCMEEVKEHTGVTIIHKDEAQSYVPRMENFVLSGSRNQIPEAVQLLSEKAGIEKIIKEKAQTFWLRWLEEAYPDLESRAYFLPAVPVQRETKTRQKLGDKLLDGAIPATAAFLGVSPHPSPRASPHPSPRASPHPSPLPSPRVSPQPSPRASPQPSGHLENEAGNDVTSDAALQHVLVCMQKLAEVHKEIFMGISRLQFSDCLAEFCYTCAAALLPQPPKLPPALPKKWKEGDCDFLMIHRFYGLVLFKIKATRGGRLRQGEAGDSEFEAEVADRLSRAVTQLRRQEALLAHLVSDVIPGVHIVKVLVVPNLSCKQLKNVLSTKSELTQELCLCLGAADEDDLTSRCLCADHLLTPHTPGHVGNGTLKKLLDWWQRCVTRAGSVHQMSPEIYKMLVARFCGPATTVAVPCTSSPRLAMTTMTLEGSFYSLFALFPEQVNLIHSEPLRVFLAGPPGTGKTVVLLLVALEWLRHNHDVYVMGTAEHSRIACCMLHHLLQQGLERMRQSGEECGQLHLLQYNFRGGTDVDKATQELTAAAKNGEVYVIADDVGPDDASGPVQDFPAVWKPHFKAFCENLLTYVPHLHLWAASCKHGIVPSGWQLECFTRPLRCPPAVLKEVEKAEHMDNAVLKFGSQGVPNHAGDPPVKLVHHDSQHHAGQQPVSCVQCGQEVARFLQGLIVARQESPGDKMDVSDSGDTGSTASALQFRDMVVLCLGRVTNTSGVMEGLRSEGLPVRVLETAQDMEDLATARSDVVWVSSGNLVRGIERKVVVCVRNEFPDRDKYNRLYPLSRCMSQLVLVVPYVSGLH